ncbi:hypothetical protein JF544_16470 [Halobacillus kuroshimensis]|uniref:Uncharacterized protein n=1 Tax=Halobacillus kuroshimensis TaxID=302481 RepID=A0ABS3DZX1_9BACI|nr:hypothetical protein [Halobacillus kuroshimensis]MBN8236854.1 hypothetical protein [Halobacillus kuroshimensis]
MKVSELDYKTKHVIDQLQSMGYTDIEGLSYDELVGKLAMARAMEVDVTSDQNKWF